MKNVSRLMLGLSLAVVGSSFAAAQEMQGPPKVLYITREFVKPGKSGALHDKSESNSWPRWPPPSGRPTTLR